MNEEKICCPKFDSAPWENKEFSWENKKFIKDSVSSFFYMPLNFGAVVRRMMAKIEKSGTSAQDWMGLSDHTSKWNMDLYLAVDREVVDAENVTMTGKFFSKVYEGNFKDTGIWMKDFNNYAKDKGLTIGKTYMWYTTCPKCAKKYGKNYMVVVGKIN